MSHEGRAAFSYIKDLLSQSFPLVIMNEDPLILYTDAIGGVLIQVQNGIEKPVIFISHTLSDQATLWGMMELELYPSCVACRISHLTFLASNLRSEWTIVLSIQFVGAKVGALEGPPIGVPVFGATHPWRSEYRCRWPYKSVKNNSNGCQSTSVIFLWMTRSSISSG